MVFLCQGVTQLPSVERMQEEISARNAWIGRTFHQSVRHGILNDWITALDSVAEEIGCKPDLSMKTAVNTLLLMLFGRTILI